MTFPGIMSKDNEFFSLTQCYYKRPYKSRVYQLHWRDEREKEISRTGRPTGKNMNHECVILGPAWQLVVTLRFKEKKI